MGRVRDALPLLAWFGSLAAGIALFVQLGDGALATPALTEPSEWSAWAADRDPVVAGLAVLRLVVLGLAWYLVGVTTVGLVARLLRLARLVRLADALSGPVVRHVLRQALGVSLAVGVVASSAGAGPRGAASSAPSADVATAVALDDVSGDVSEEVPEGGGAARVRAVALDAEAAPPSTAAMAPVDEPTPEASPHAGDETERMVGLPPALADEADVPGDLAGDLAEDLGDDGDHAAGDTGDEASDAGDGPRAVGGQHEVRAGEHLWSIAEATVVASYGDDVTQAQIARYWRTLIADNRDRLADPDNPDLLFPGQVLRLPDAHAAVGT